MRECACGHDEDEHSDEPLSECCGARAVEDTEICAKCRDASGFSRCGECDCGGYETGQEVPA